MSGYTPGPWLAQPDPHANPGEWVIGIKNGPVDYVAVCSARDARLIAAAPDSHEANKLSLTVLCAIRAAGVLSHDQNLLRDLDSAIDANRAALAKATGGQS